jgi:hypothetical protein
MCIEKLLVRLANLDFLIDQVDNIKNRLFKRNDGDGKQFNPTKLFEPIYVLIKETATVMVIQG